MNADQKTVAIGAISGVACMAVAVACLYHLLPIPQIVSPVAYTLQFEVFALLPLFASLAAVGNARFLSKAIDPTRHAEDRAMEINGRVADNTLQQTFVFVVSTLALSTFLTPQHITIIPAVVAVFVAARVLFWIGYRINPLYRAPGMAATSYLNLGIMLACLYFIFF